jgi:hypothetical protein
MKPWRPRSATRASRTSTPSWRPPSAVTRRAGPTAATVTSVAASAVGLFLLGSAITLLTHRGVLRAGSRQLLIGLAAAAVTFGIGRLVGVEIA